MERLTQRSFYLSSALTVGDTVYSKDNLDKEGTIRFSTFDIPKDDGLLCPPYYPHLIYFVLSS